MFDIESLDVESTAVVLSIAMIEFNLDEKPVYKDLIDRAIFVKFDVDHQIKNYHRTVSKETLEWWAKRSLIVKEKSFKPNVCDVSVLEGLEILRTKGNFKKEAKYNQDVMFWARGGLDQVVFEGLCRAVGEPVFAHYSNWRDVRTAVELLVEGSVHGYCIVPGLDQDTVHKHDPVCDCAYDIMQLLVNNLKKD